MGFTWAFSLMPYGSWWRRHRKAFHQYFYPNAAAHYIPKQMSEARKTLVRLLEEPNEFMDHIRVYVFSRIPILSQVTNLKTSYFAASILDIVYGIKVDRKTNQEYVKCVEKVMDAASLAGIPGAFLVDMLPICMQFPRYFALARQSDQTSTVKYVPSWVPGANFKIFANRYNLMMPRLVNDPITFVKHAIVRVVVPVIKARGLADDKILQASQPDHQSIVADRYHRLKNVADHEEVETVTSNMAAIAYAGMHIDRNSTYLAK